MNARMVQGVFETEAEILDATRAARTAGLEIVDVFAPYAVHGIEEAMGIRRSRLPWVCFVLGTAGLALALWFQYWTSAVDWPLNVGGKPFDSLPAFVPITFEITILLAGLGTVAALFVRCGLLPGRAARLPARGVTDDRFALLVRLRGAEHAVTDVRDFMATRGAVEIEDFVEEAV